MTAASNPSSGIIHSGLADRLIEVVYAIILVVTVIGWFFVGFAVWVPLLVRSTMVLAGVVLYASLFGSKERVTLAENNLHAAVRFYLRGFAYFVDFYRERHSDQRGTGILDPLSAMKWRELLIECLWVAGVWLALSLALHALLAKLAL